MDSPQSGWRGALVPSTQLCELELEMSFAWACPGPGDVVGVCHTSSALLHDCQGIFKTARAFLHGWTDDDYICKQAHTFFHIMWAGYMRATYITIGGDALLSA